MKRLVLLLMSLALAACSGHTIYRFEVNLLSFIPQNQGQGELNLTTSQILPMTLQDSWWRYPGLKP